VAAKKKTDLDGLQGTWDVVALELDGQEMGAVPPHACIQVKGSRFTTSGMGAEYTGDVTLDPTANPKTFDLLFRTGPEKGNTSLGIYELDGDSWKMCLTTRGGKRPAKFATKPGTGMALQTLTRRGSAKAAAPAKAKAKAAKASAAGNPAGELAPELDGEWTPQELIQSGQPLDPAYLQMGRRVAENGELKVYMGPQVIIHVKFAVDRSQTPMAMNYVHVRGGQEQAGIYKLEGDLLTTCVAKTGGPRPDTFGSQRGDGRTYTVWKKKG
jgi:uncharacterized protein (TIGR03067 family)